MRLGDKCKINIQPLESNYELPMSNYMVVAELIDEEGNQNILKYPAVLSKQ